MTRVPWGLVGLKAILYASGATLLHHLGVYYYLYGFLPGRAFEMDVRLVAPLYFIVAFAWFSFWYSSVPAMAR
jgi:hypothetical protein